MEAGRGFRVSTVTSATLPLHGTTKVGTLTPHPGVGNDSAPGLIHHGRVAPRSTQKEQCLRPWWQHPCWRRQCFPALGSEHTEILSAPLESGKQQVRLRRPDEPVLTNQSRRTSHDEPVTTNQSFTNYATSVASLVSDSFFAENETKTPLTITYSTGIKKRLRTVENSMPPTIAVPTE